VQAVVDFEKADGTKLSARCDHPRGSFENPLSRTQVESKFRTYAEGVLSGAAIAATIEAIDKLEHLGSVRKLMDMLRATPSQAERAPRAAARG
jgi:2-methylcitrate dehydratase PrpD